MQTVNAAALKSVGKKGKNNLKYEHEQCSFNKQYWKNVL